MNLKDIASVSGKSGLFKILKPTRTGVVLESIDEAKKKTITNMNYRVSVLKEISIYTTTKDGSVPLTDVMLAIQEKYTYPLEVGKTDKELNEFIASIVPNFDSGKVYPSDIKKLISWYNLLCKFSPQTFTDEEPVEESKA
ncbi:MAG: hypothetical protein EAZ97_09470 [Bacteroidetes bacterium]|nr:MAG: hypothetical protein EAZ97_09470 [Bacteroidota bacterium]